MSRRCAICDSPKRTDIEAMIISGAPCRAVAERYGTAEDPLTKSSVNRHQVGHMLPDQLAQRGEEAAAKLWSAKDTTREMLKEAIADLKKFREGGANGLVPAMTGQVRNLLETLAKLDNQLTMARTVKNTVNIVQVFPPAVMAAFKDKHPEAFAWLLDELRVQATNLRQVPGVVEDDDDEEDDDG